MPTAGRLAGAVIFALFGWYLGGVLGPFFPEERPPGYLVPLCAAIGLFLGWTVCGGRAGFGYRNAVSNGLTTAAAFSFCVIGSLSFGAMIRNALRNRYDGPMDAIVGVFDLMLEMSQDFFDVSLIITVLVGSIFCAVIVEYFGKRYP